MSIIKLQDYKQCVLEECLSRNQIGHNYSKKILIEAIEAQIKNELRYNTETGKTYTKALGLSSQYVYKKDIPVYETNIDAAIWEFSGYVRNSASRKKRGYSLI